GSPASPAQGTHLPQVLGVPRGSPAPLTARGTHLPPSMGTTPPPASTRGNPVRGTRTRRSPAPVRGTHSPSPRPMQGTPIPRSAAPASGSPALTPKPVASSLGSPAPAQGMRDQPSPPRAPLWPP